MYEIDGSSGLLLPLALILVCSMHVQITGAVEDA
jgi:hypothetical protein